MQKIQRSILLWSFAVFLLLLVPADGYENDEVLKYMCSPVGGVAFWRDVVECCLPMDEFMQSALKNCLLLLNPYTVESTRRSVCANKKEWGKVMDCVHLRLVQLQYMNDFKSDVNPNKIYKACVETLIGEMKQTKNDPWSGLPIYSRCLAVLHVIAPQ